MSKRLTQVNELQDYIAEIMQRSQHHAQCIENVVLGVFGAIVWLKDATSDIAVVRPRARGMDVLYVRIGGERYVFSYSPERQALEVRRRSMNAPVIHSFCNSTSAGEVRRAFEDLQKTRV